MSGEIITTRKGHIQDLVAIKQLADENRKELGFITRATIHQAVIDGSIMVICVDFAVVGFQHYYHRKRDKQTTLYHKVIQSKYRLRNLGRLLVDAVAKEAREMGREKLLLKCPEDLPSNQFHLKYGFKFIGTEIGKKRRLNVYEYLLNQDTPKNAVEENQKE